MPLDQIRPDRVFTSLPRRIRLSRPLARNLQTRIMSGKNPFLQELMKRDVLIYGLIGGVLITLLKWSEYRFLVMEHSIEIYGGLIAATFAALGIWLGLKLTGRHERVVVKEVPVPAPAGEPFLRNEKRREDLGVTPRELEILELIAQGMSNREIAEKLFVSENTVKTHSSRVFDKLGAKRRTQAVQLGKEFGLLP